MLSPSRGKRPRKRMEKKRISHLAGNEVAGKRLDEALFLLGAGLSRSKCQKLIKGGDCLVNGKEESAHYLVQDGDSIEYSPYEEPSLELKPEKMDVPIVYEDEDIIIVDKPAGLVVHPGAGNHEHTLVNGLLGKYELGGDDEVRPGLAHRIDKDTSGLLAVAKSESALLNLQEQLRTHAMRREYLALADGIIEEARGKIIAPLARSRENRLKQAVDLSGKMAITHFEVIRRFPFAKATLLRCVLETGRTHQIRAHLEYIKHPIIGDPLYGKGNRRLGANRQLLHAEKLILTHPRTGERMEFYCPLPKDFQSILDSLS